MAFYCHQPMFATKSSNSFGGLLHSPPEVLVSLPSSLESGLLTPTGARGVVPPRLLTTIVVAETSVVFNIVLHMIYPGLCVWRPLPIGSMFT